MKRDFLMCIYIRYITITIIIIVVVVVVHNAVDRLYMWRAWSRERIHMDFFSATNTDTSSQSFTLRLVSHSFLSTFFPISLLILGAVKSCSVPNLTNHFSLKAECADQIFKSSWRERQWTQQQKYNQTNTKNSSWNFKRNVHTYTQRDTKSDIERKREREKRCSALWIAHHTKYSKMRLEKCIFRGKNRSVVVNWLHNLIISTCQRSTENTHTYKKWQASKQTNKHTTNKKTNLKKDDGEYGKKWERKKESWCFRS